MWVVAIEKNTFFDVKLAERDKVYMSMPDGSSHAQNYCIHTQQNTGSYGALRSYVLYLMGPMEFSF